MKTSFIALIPMAVLVFARTAMAQVQAETILPAILPSNPTQVKAENVSKTPNAGVPARTKGVVVNPTPTRPAVSAPHATLISENSAPKRDTTVHYYLPVGAISPQSGIRTYPGTTAATITNGATRIARGIPLGSTAARLAGSPGSRVTLPSTKAPTVSTR